MILHGISETAVTIFAEMYLFQEISIIEIVCSWCCGGQRNSPWDYTYYTVSLLIVKTGNLIYVFIDPNK
jgi:hypothetical protein